MSVLWIHAAVCSLAKLDRNIRNGLEGDQLDYEKKTVAHMCAIASHEIDRELRELRENTDTTMRAAAKVAMARMNGYDNADYAIPERTPDMGARGSGKSVDQSAIRQFGEGFVPMDADRSSEVSAG
jgi:hypothetical protein